MPREPRSPQTFFGRDSELAQIIHIIFTHLGSRPARIAILGPGGYGKTTLANAVLTHYHVQEHFRDARYFVACESLFSPGALLMEIAKSLGLFDRATDVSWPRIRTALNTKDCILCLDNFESPWDQDADMRNSVEELLSRVAELQHVSLLITMRGTVRPAQTQWTMPLLPPLTTLDYDAAKRVWKHTTDNYDVFAEELIKAVDYVPLAVSLLAHLAQATSPQLLLKEWNEKYTEFIYTNQANKQSNVESSIQVSLNSGRMRANPCAKELLGILSMLPDGIHMQQIERFKKLFEGINILSSLRTLQECSLISVIGERYQTHPIIRNFCNNYILISKEHKNALRDFYLKLASISYNEAQASTYTEMVLEVNNTQAMLFSLIKSNYKKYAKLVQAITSFTNFHNGIGDHSDKLISLTVEFLQQQDISSSLTIKCLQEWGKLNYYSNNHEIAKYRLQEAEKLCKAGKENQSPLHASIFHWLGRLYLFQGALDKAIASFQNALRLHKLANNIIGQGDNYSGLGKIYIQLNKIQEAKDAFYKALTFHKLSNSNLGQGDDYFELGNIYHRLDNLDEAEVLYHQALKFHRLANGILGQGNDYNKLSHIYLKLNKLNDAKASFYKALEFHQLANDILWQGDDYLGLRHLYFRLNKLNKAYNLFQKALESYKLSNNILYHGNALQNLGRVQMARSQLQDAKTLFENALAMHRQAEDITEQEWDQYYLNEVLLKMNWS